METIKQFEANGYTVRIHPDTDPESPRQWDNLGHMVGWHRRYNLGDEQPTASPSEWLKDFKQDNPQAIILPLFMYEHGGVSLSTGAFSCPWDSGQVGYIYATPESIALMGTSPDRVEEVLRGEVETYSQYLNGEVYGFTITDADGEEVAACWGFYGVEEAENAAREDVPDAPATSAYVTYGEGGLRAFLVAVPGLDNMLLIEAEDASDAAAEAARDIAHKGTADGFSVGEVKVYEVPGTIRHLAAGTSFHADENGELID